MVIDLSSEQAGDESSFRKLFETYAKRVHEYIYFITKSEYLTEEVTQELFLILWRKRKDLRVVENIDGYIFRIARNLAIGLLKRAALDSKLAAELYKHSAKESDQIEELMGERTVQQLIEKAVLELPAQPRKIYLLSRRENMNVDEIAAATGLSRNTIKNHLQKALNDIRDYLVRNGYRLALASLLARKFFW
ncbi:RNA polymerase sigma factor [Filimonas effusa]|uniref:RNA polymerase sigma-70 factor n=1 Tax=Filimonas effusa TaxID=2508721 RepID=A0A4Q1D838_9BACT|nr:RNA polymerase sigma-70 factor [Filimonas effusa]RXK85477.1 RNA polymerase sigma-70 factor [Filimonas effusa]